ncbi:hypothetical protein SNOG_12637 [Parastagonospora nodorum SN15]|uniref:Uncharacterized protein n=1 Tax=Phaeosphaeria nodorum (strain SN15 / ATCC MYA-4574 / FGSC 10173) TaxID=321614 RepID=Q0U6H7_PHANO|nr:hypothetical protein SNOG_12637 [Parastagonospora nodorum SN15]EAT79935.1 hypothetical protein SNOG_12637 [Parastagonospora nodorum SN15]
MSEETGRHKRFRDTAVILPHTSLENLGRHHKFNRKESISEVR